MAGGQSDGQPGGRPEDRSQGHADGYTGGLSGGEWWRVDGPWRVIGAATPPEEASDEASDEPQGGDGGDGVYVVDPAEFAAPGPVRPGPVRPGPSLAKPVPPSRSTESRSVAGPAQPAGPPAPEVPVQQSRSIFRKRSVAAPPVLPPMPEQPPAWLIAPVSPGPVLPRATAADYPGWDSVQIAFPPDDTEPAEAAEPPEEVAAVEPPAARSRWIPVQRRPGIAPVTAAADVVDAQPLPSRGFLAGRRPSPLLLLSAAVLVGGSVTGLILVMLAGWVLGYLSQQLGELTKRFAVIGIPLITMTVSAFWFWGRSTGRWGEPLAKGAPMTHAVFTSTPGVLRLAAVLSALFLFVVAMRRRSQA
ncbi:hypothetical protein P3T37_003314 [Kitasatospora sp. MAA4]|uniref:hypothetical protein n=1 Tax=Kitasatospora sp. MAA4 TaxID=3035093 RepID=UPI002476950C|nr:hypothetical protein [Kitasatospora sp. MAA4]MDH6133915.1 hypothetical protein [Kitasatospora sp. MAA4]